MSVRRRASVFSASLSGGVAGGALGFPAPTAPGVPGAQVRAVFRRDALPRNITVAVGAGGLGVAGGNGLPGGATSFGPVTAGGGAGGILASGTGGGTWPGDNGQPGHIIVWEWS